MRDWCEDWYEKCPRCESSNVKQFWTFDYLNECKDCGVVYNVNTGNIERELDNKNRLIEISRCVDCPNHSEYDWFCNKAMKKTSSESGWPIPDWCPLPKAKNNK